MIVIENCAVATVAGDGLRATGTSSIDGNRIDGGRPGPARGEAASASTRSGCLATPGLINCHHHLYQWATRGLAQQATLFEWLVELYPIVGADRRADRARGGARRARRRCCCSGCTTASDHHYVFPRGAGDLLAVEIEAARELGIRFHPCRGAMDLGRVGRRAAAGLGGRGPRRDPRRLRRRARRASTTRRRARCAGSRSRRARRSASRAS